MSKVLYLDTETTGLDAKINDIIQLAMIVEIDGVVKGEYNFKCQPFSYDNIETDALLTHGIKIDEIKKFPPPLEMFADLEMVFDGHVNRYDKADKFLPAGYQTVFDLDFLAQFFRKARPEDQYGLGSFIKWSPFDLLAHLRNKAFVNGTDFKDFKLATVAAAHDIELDAHDALADIRATRELCKAYYEEFLK
jgi:DNA polymerase III epsilon subunit-like protein